MKWETYQRKLEKEAEYHQAKRDQRLSLNFRTQY